MIAEFVPILKLVYNATIVGFNIITNALINVLDCISSMLQLETHLILLISNAYCHARMDFIAFSIQQKQEYIFVPSVYTLALLVNLKNNVYPVLHLTFITI